MERHSWLSLLECCTQQLETQHTHTHTRAGRRFGNSLVIIILFLFLIILVAYTENNYLKVRYLYRACFRIVVQKRFKICVSGFHLEKEKYINGDVNLEVLP